MLPIRATWNLCATGLALTKHDLANERNIGKYQEMKIESELDDIADTIF